jgi:hypothetical protein
MHIKYHEDLLRHPNNINVITAKIFRGYNVGVTDGREFMKYGVKMGTGGTIYQVS